MTAAALATVAIILLAALPSSSTGATSRAARSGEVTITFSGSYSEKLQDLYLSGDKAGQPDHVITESARWTFRWTGPINKLENGSGVTLPWQSTDLTGTISDSYDSGTRPPCQSSLSAAAGQTFSAIQTDAYGPITLEMNSPQATGPCSSLGCPGPAVSYVPTYCDPAAAWDAQSGGKSFPFTGNQNLDTAYRKFTGTASTSIAACAGAGSASGGGSCGRYIALGDSYSAGEGAKDYFPGTTKDGCDRSRDAYPVLIADALRFSPFGGAPGADSEFAACSGATTSATQSSFKGEPPQIDHVPPDASLVTISIGGNDIGFAPVIKYCLTHKDCARKEETSVDRNLQRAEGNILGALLAIRRKAPDARIIVVGYPNFMPASGTCRPTAGVLKWLLELSAKNVEFIHEHINMLNAEIKSLTAGRLRFGYVAPDPTVWAQHTICQAGSWFVKVDLKDALRGRSMEFFHPTAAGQQELAKEVLAVARQVS